MRDASSAIDQLVLCATRGELRQKKRIPSMAGANKSDKRVTVIVGAGTAGGTCVSEAPRLGVVFFSKRAAALCQAETLRQEGYTGRIVMIGKEAYLPYDRTKLSKALTSRAEQLQLVRDAAFYFAADRVFASTARRCVLQATRRRSQVEQYSDSVSRQEQDFGISFFVFGFGFTRSILCSLLQSYTPEGGKSQNLKFDNALLCTGGTPRKHTLSAATADLKAGRRRVAGARLWFGACFSAARAARSQRHCRQCDQWCASRRRGSHRSDTLADTNVVIIGSSFIGMEAAAAVASKAASVTVIGEAQCRRLCLSG